MDTIFSGPLAETTGPKYGAVVQTIEKAIETGALKPGDKLPPVRDLAWTLKITPGTVARAYTILTDKGRLDAQVGRGTFVATPHMPQPMFPPIEVDAVAHNSETAEGPVSLFSPHLPSLGQTELIRRHLAKIAEDPPSGLMHYPNAASSLPARQSVLHWLRDTGLGPISAEDVVLTHGGQNAVLLILQTLLRGRRPVVLVEELSYPGFRRATEMLRATVVPVAMDEKGLIPEALDEAARTHNAQILCTSPEVHNPTGLMTPLERRREISNIAKARDLQIIDDDCYRVGPAQTLSYRAIAPRRSWYISSPSKSITPALRLGFAVAPEGQGSLLRRAAEQSFFGVATPLMDLCAALLMDLQLPAITEKVRQAINLYVQSAVNILGGYQVSWRPDMPFLWVTLPSGWRASAFCQAAEAQGVQIRPAEEFAVRDARAPHAVRIAVNAGIGLDRFEAAVTVLRDLLDNPQDEIRV